MHPGCAGQSCNAHLTFSPLFIGAVVASQSHRRNDPWFPQAFSPLFIGAVVASVNPGGGGSGNFAHLSVPYSSGPWLHLPALAGATRQYPCFQSPIHRGRGCIGCWCGDHQCNRRCFQSPIHRGRGCILMPWVLPPPPTPAFQSPIHRGRGCIILPPVGLQISSFSFSPLFIGAVVASDCPPKWPYAPSVLSVPYSSGPWLHRPPCWKASRMIALSVPYSSGPWLHLKGPQRRGGARKRFQSPIHRGRGCIRASLWQDQNHPDAFSPLFIGAVVASQCGPVPAAFPAALSVPYSSGPWLHRRRLAAIEHALETFSPLFIGAVVASLKRYAGDWAISLFQSPIHRGRGCIDVAACLARRPDDLSVPYSSGPWLHLDSMMPTMIQMIDPFSPLFIGAVVASMARKTVGSPGPVLSVPYSSGPWLHPRGPANYCARRSRTFSPLFIGAVVASDNSGRWFILREYTFSPLFIGAVVAS